MSEARGGTLFVDGVDAVPLAVRERILVLVDEPSMDEDVRVVGGASDGRGLEGRFGSTLRLPPLRDRRGDLPALVHHFLRTLGGRTVGSIEDHLDPAVMRRLEAHSWPGNVRELRLVVERLLAAAGTGRIVPGHIPPDLA